MMTIAGIVGTDADALARLHRASSRRPAPTEAVDPATPVDRTRPFLCESLTPLAYAPSYPRLTPPQRLRYNQLTAMHFNEMMVLLETTFDGLLRRLAEEEIPGFPPGLAACAGDFLREETEHAGMFRRLNRLSEPAWYADRDFYILRVPRAAQWILARVLRRPEWFSFALWILLSQEEHTLELSRRCARLPADAIEPHYRAVYAAHAADEARHVRVDVHFLDRFHRPASRWRRAANAAVFRLLVRRFFLVPSRGALRVVDLLTREFPELRPWRRRLAGELKDLPRDPAYQRVLYSRESTPLTFAGFDAYPEFQSIRGILTAYRPRAAEAAG